MSKTITLSFTALALAFAVGAHAQSNDFATGNMSFDAKAIDVNGDRMISKVEFMGYGQKMWDSMTKGAASLRVEDATRDFARGNMRADAVAMDADHDGSVTKAEFMAYEGKQFDAMKNKDGMMSVEDATKNFARGNRP